MRLLIDECVDERVRLLFPRHECQTASELSDRRQPVPQRCMVNCAGNCGAEAFSVGRVPKLLAAIRPFGLAARSPREV